MSEENKMYWEELTKEAKIEWYKSYVDEMIYENGDNCKYMTFEEFSENSKGLWFGL